MKRVAVALTFGMCAVSARASAEPRAAKLASHVKAPATPPAEKSHTHSELVAAADADGDAHVNAAELESFVVREVEQEVAQKFRRLDRNADGRVVLAEVPIMLPARFQRFDQNRDGSFTLAELAGVMLGQAVARCRLVLAQLDHDGDGELSLADAESAGPTRISKR